MSIHIQVHKENVLKKSSCKTLIIWKIIQSKLNQSLNLCLIFADVKSNCILVATSITPTTTTTTTQTTTAITTTPTTTTTTNANPTTTTTVAPINTTVDFVWSEFGPWSSCSHFCNNGTRSRERNCSNPELLYSGQKCKGEFEEIEECNTHPCLTDISKCKKFK